MIMDKKEIGLKIREKRNKNGLDQMTLADLAQVGINTLIKLERGESNPNLDTLSRVLRALGMELIVTG